MKLLEYEAKRILSQYNVSTPNGVVVKALEKPTAFSLPRVIKSQVPIGGRGKAGGVKLVNSEAEFDMAFFDISKLEICGHLPSKLLIEEVISIDKELYLSIIIDREDSRIKLLAHKNGGVDIESNTTSEFFRAPLDKHRVDSIAQALADYYDLASKEFLFADLLENMLEAFKSEDMTLLEINPLILDHKGNLVAGDAKIELDDAAQFRHEEWNFEAPIKDAHFICLDDKGKVATVANGAGLAMATVDAIEAAGLSAANFLDVGGAADSDSLANNFREIIKISGLEAIVVNIFGGIVRCDVVAEALIEARDNIDSLPPLYIRLTGTNSEAASKILASNGIKNYSNLEDIISELKK